MDKIKKNAVQCKLCNDIIESTHRHDFKYCKCGNIFVDGGHEYLRRGGGLKSYTELSEYEEEPSITPESQLPENQNELEQALKLPQASPLKKYAFKQLPNKRVDRGVRINKPTRGRPRGRG